MLCQFLVLAGKRCWFNFGSNTYLLLRVQYSCGGALVFYLQWEMAGKIYYDRKKKVPVVCLAGCAVVSVFGSCDYDRKKKVPVVCLAGCAVVSVFGSGDYDRK